MMISSEINSQNALPKAVVFSSSEQGNTEADIAQATVVETPAAAASGRESADRLLLRRTVEAADKLIRARRESSAGQDSAAVQLAEYKLHSSLQSLSSAKVAAPLSLVSMSEGDLSGYGGRGQSFSSVSGQTKIFSGNAHQTRVKAESSFQIWNELSDAIGNIKSDYLSVYENAVSLYANFYRGFSNVLANMGTYVQKGGDGNSVKLRVSDLRSDLRNLIFSTDKRLEIPSNEKIPWTSRLGQGFVYYSTRSLSIDTSPLQKMRDSLPQSDEMSSATFQAWKAGFDSQDETMKNSLQGLMQKYSNAQSQYDNLVQVLSSSITTMLQTDESFLRI